MRLRAYPEGRTATQNSAKHDGPWQVRECLSVLFHSSSGAPASCLAPRTVLLAVGKLPLWQQ